ncbi:MAG: T9SS type A sorting domain-containing protein [Candidatus Marinimicrobia bacterium]|nr:T9SS type A sorting domain-containing protein [Candidatus Neomarinimicrobiota bacterium]
MRRIIYIFIILLAVLPKSQSIAQTGWFWQNPYPTGGGLGTIEFVSSTEGWIAAERGLLHTTDAGTTWEVVSPDPGRLVGFGLGVNPALSFIDATTGWAMGSFGGFGEDNTAAGAGLFKTTDGGATWAQQNVGSDLLGLLVQFVSADEGWAVVADGTLDPFNLVGSILHSSNGGNTWNTQYTTNPQNVILSISFIDANNGWALVDSIGDEDVIPPSTIIHTTDGGATWVTQLRDTTEGAFEVIQFVDANNGWVVGDSAKILRTINGGTTWTLVTNTGIPSSSRSGALFFLDPNIGWIAVGSEGPEDNIVLHTVDGGVNWTTSSVLGTSDIFGIDFVDANSGWVASDGGGIAHTTNGGETWTLQSSSVINNELHDVFALPDGVNLWTVGEIGTILHTADGGSVWEIQTSDLTDRVASVFFIDDQVGWAVGGGPNISGIVGTSDGGATWVSQITFTGDLYSVRFLNANEGWAAGTGGLMLHTTDAGANWANQTSGTSDLLYSVFFVDQNNGWAVGENGTIIGTIDGGANWTAEVSGTANHLRDVSFTNTTTGIAVGDSGTVIRTTDAGANWIPQVSGTNSDLFGVFFVDAGIGHAVGRNGTILYTTDGGQNWTNQVGGTGRTLRGVAFSDLTSGTVVGDDGVILRTTSGGMVVSVKENLHSHLPRSHMLRQNYPNPFNPTTTIEYELANAGKVQLIVYNLLGQEIERLVDGTKSAGKHNINWDASNLASGVYLYRLQAGDFVQTRKMVLLK